MKTSNSKSTLLCKTLPSFTTLTHYLPTSTQQIMIGTWYHIKVKKCCIIFTQKKKGKNNKWIFFVIIFKDSMKQMIKVMSVILQQQQQQQVPTAIILVDIIREYGWYFGTVNIMMWCYFYAKHRWAHTLSSFATPVTHLYRYIFTMP